MDVSVMNHQSSQSMSEGYDERMKTFKDKDTPSVNEVTIVALDLVQTIKSNTFERESDLLMTNDV